ncbi:hypothetical protein INR49_031316 [Caranx melampygus]|nr:hypothetical protein INR49_031316 [Caranx melampygus]
MYPPPKAEEACVFEPGIGCESLGNVQVVTAEATESNPSDEKTVRRAFVRKVFCILTVQLLFTFTVVCVFTFSSVVKKAVQDNLWVYISSFIIFAVVAITLSCCESFSRRHPWNIVGLAMITLTLSYVVGTVASFHDTTAVVISMASTLAISLAIIAYSVQARFQYDICYLVLLVLVVDLLMFVFYSTFYYSHILDIVYGSLGALLFSLVGTKQDNIHQ